MIYEELWEFSDAQSMPNNTTGICTDIVDLTSSKYDEWVNMAVPLWLVVTCNTVSSTGTRLQIRVYQHSTSTITDGDLLMSGRDIAVADLSANARDPGHWLFCVPWMSLVCNLQTADVDRYIGPVMSATGDCSDGKIDAMLLATTHPPIPTTQVTSSNI